MNFLRRKLNSDNEMLFLVTAKGYAKNTPPIMKGVIIMSLEKMVLIMATHYYANLIDIHNALHALGLRSDEQAEEFNKKHVMKLVNIYARRGYDITKITK